MLIPPWRNKGIITKQTILYSADVLNKNKTKYNNACLLSFLRTEFVQLFLTSYLETTYQYRHLEPYDTSIPKSHQVKIPYQFKKHGWLPVERINSLPAIFRRNISLPCLRACKYYFIKVQSASEVGDFFSVFKLLITYLLNLQ